MAIPTDTFGEGSTLLSITKKSGSDINFNTIIETVDIPGGEKGVDPVPTIRGGRLKKTLPQEDTEITLEGYAIEIGTQSGSAGNGFYDLMGSMTTSSSVGTISADHNFDEYQLVILATDNGSQTTATAATTSGDNAMRWKYQNGHFTKVDASFTDGVWKFSITFKVTPFNKAGTSNTTFESTQTGELAVISAYA